MTPHTPPVNNPLGDVITDRLDLRRMKPSDIDGLAAVFAKEEVWAYPYGRAFSRSETEAFLQTQATEWDRCQFGLWVARHRDDDRVIGYVGMSVPTFLPDILPAVEVGWRFDPDYWGRGLATEGALAALAEGFTTLGLEEITSVPQVDNPASWRVCERLGMSLRSQVTIPANYRRGAVEGLLYVLSRTQWRSQQRCREWA